MINYTKIEIKPFLVLWIKTISDLCKFKLSSAVSLTTLTGYIIAKGSLNIKIIILLLAMIILTSGASAFNQYQEKNIDSIMERTKYRPLPACIVSELFVIYFSIILITSGLILIYFTTGYLCFSLALIGLIWYNFVYTKLKKITPFYNIPGSLVGVIPPLIGYFAEDNNILSLKILVFSLFILFWQIPHFWLLLLIHTNDYKALYLPSVINIFNCRQLGKIIFSWIILTASCAIFFPLFGLINYTFGGYYLIIILSIVLIIKSSFILFNDDNLIYKSIFFYINLYLLIIMFIICIQNI